MTYYLSVDYLPVVFIVGVVRHIGLGHRHWDLYRCVASYGVCPIAACKYIMLWSITGTYYSRQMYVDPGDVSLLLEEICGRTCCVLPAYLFYGLVYAISLLLYMYMYRYVTF